MSTALEQIGPVQVSAFVGSDGRARIQLTMMNENSYAQLRAIEVSTLVATLARWLSETFGEEWVCEVDGKF